MTSQFLETEHHNELGRYEIKMVFADDQSGLVKSLVLGHSALFSQAYPPRQVNNIYFDSPDYQLRDAHIQGSFQRYKIRLRWYHDAWVITNGMMEYKIKSGNLGQKHTVRIPDKIDLQSQSWDQVLNMISSSLESRWIADLGALVPVLINSYQREYYHSADRQIRITIDRDLRSYDQVFGTRPNLSYSMPTRKLIILEVKAEGNQAEKIAHTLAEFPQYSSAYSKYIQGTERS